MKPDAPRTMPPVEARLSAVAEAHLAELEQLLDQDPTRCALIAGYALDVWAQFVKRRARTRSTEGRQS